MKIELKVEGLGHVPAFKNNKLLTRGRLITNPKKQRFMKAVVQSFVSQLSCLYRTTANAIPTEPSAHCLIASSLPEKDSVRFIVDERITARFVPKGQEGANIVIEPHEDTP